MMLDKNYYIVCMKMLCNSFDKSFSQEQAEAYYTALGKFSEKQMMYMTKKVIEEDVFFPRPANLIVKLNKLEVSIESKADEFVGHVRALLGIYGADALLEIFGKGTFPLKEPKRFCDPVAYEIVKRNLDRLRNHEAKDDMALNAQLKKMYISEHEYQKATIVKQNNPQLASDNIKALSETLKLDDGLEHLGEHEKIEIDGLPFDEEQND